MCSHVIDNRVGTIEPSNSQSLLKEPLPILQPSLIPKSIESQPKTSQ